MMLPEGEVGKYRRRAGEGSGMEGRSGGWGLYLPLEGEGGGIVGSGWGGPFSGGGKEGGSGERLWTPWRAKSEHCVQGGQRCSRGTWIHVNRGALYIARTLHRNPAAESGVVPRGGAGHEWRIGTITRTGGGMEPGDRDEGKEGEKERKVGVTPSVSAAKAYGRSGDYGLFPTPADTGL